jgi:predicted permease
MLETLVQDARYGIRSFVKSPILVLTIVMTLALGIGANTAIFSLVNAIVLKPLPVRDPGRLVVVGDPSIVHLRTDAAPPRVDMFSYPLYHDMLAANQVFSGMLISGDVYRVRVTRPGPGNQDSSVYDTALAALVSGNYFSLLGISPYLGRTITPEDDDAPDAHPVVVVSYAFWKEKMGGDPKVIGQTFLFNRYPLTVIGVAQPDFFGDTVGDTQDAWIPVTMQAEMLPGRPWLKDYGASWLHIIARLKDGVTMEQAEANLNIILHQQITGSLRGKFSGLDQKALNKLHIDVSEGGRGFSAIRGKYHTPLLLLMALAGLVLLIACVNVANLLLARALKQQREVAIRLAIGAPRHRIIRQLLVESVLMAFAGGALGLLVAYAGIHELLPLSRARYTQVNLDFSVLAFTLGLALLAGVMFGLAPALRSLDVSLTSTLGARTGMDTGRILAGGWNWGKVLVSAQVMLSFAVLFAAGLFVRSMQKMEHIDLGYSQENLVLLRTDPLSAGYKTFARQMTYTEELARRLATLPGVQSVTFSKNGLFGGSDSSDPIKVEGYVPSQSGDSESPSDRVGPNYFSVLKIPIIAGREMDARDAANAHRVAVINQSMARFYFGSANPLGRKITIDDPGLADPNLEVVGVAADARDQSLRGKARRRMYMPLVQSQDATGEIHFILRTFGSSDTVLAAAHKAIKAFDVNVPILNARTLTSALNDSMDSEILVARLSGFFGGVALLLVSIGLYGIMSYIVAGKTQAIGVRVALGAQRHTVLWMILREALTVVAIGIGLGIPVALIVSRTFSSMLFGLTSTEPVTIAIVVLVMATVAAAASYAPARRATKVNPIIALRQE